MWKDIFVTGPDLGGLSTRGSEASVKEGIKRK